MNTLAELEKKPLKSQIFTGKEAAKVSLKS